MQSPINAQLRQSVRNRIQSEMCTPAWRYIRHNQTALTEIEKIIADRALGSITVPNQKCGTIIYSELFANCVIDDSHSGTGNKHQIADTAFWRDSQGDKTEDGEIVEQFLRAISMCSYCQRGFMASVCVVHSGRFKRHGKPHGMPDWEFFNLARDLRDCLTTHFSQSPRHDSNHSDVDHGFTG